MRAIPVTRRGVRYESMAACARALGRTYNAVLCAHREGRLDRLESAQVHAAKMRAAAIPNAELAQTIRRGADDAWSRWLDALEAGDVAEMKRAALRMERAGEELRTPALRGEGAA